MLRLPIADLDAQARVLLRRGDSCQLELLPRFAELQERGVLFARLTALDDDVSDRLDLDARQRVPRAVRRLGDLLKIDLQRIVDAILEPRITRVELDSCGAAPAR